MFNLNTRLGLPTSDMRMKTMDMTNTIYMQLHRCTKKSVSQEQKKKKSKKDEVIVFEVGVEF